MWQKVLAISRVDIYNTFTDRSAIIVLIAVPLLISTIMGAAFGEGIDDISIQKADVGIINEDTQFFGALYSCLLISDLPETEAESCTNMFGAADETENPDDNQISDFIEGVALTDRAEAEQQVDEGELDVLLIIPPNFSTAMMNGESANIELVYNAGGGIPVDVARSIIEGITIQLNTGAIAMQVIPAYASAQGIEDANSPQMMSQIQMQAFGRSVDDVIAMQNENVEGETQEFSALQFFAPGMAIFFMTFGLASSARSILDDMRNWTLQRIITTPTTRWAYLVGKSIGAYISGIFQMTILIVATLLVNNVLFGSEIAIWGTDVLGIVLIVASVVMAATGLGMIIASLGQNSEQANAISTVVLVIMAAVGGSFIQVDSVPIVKDLRKITLNHWGLDGFIKLSQDNGTVVDVLPHIGILLVMGVVFYAIAVQLFNRRLDF